MTVFVCRMCDRDPARQDTLKAEGNGFLETVRKMLREMPGVTVKPVKCLGGCECGREEGAANGCCSVGFAAEGRFSYVFNRLKPESDAWKVLEFLRLYKKRPNGRIVVVDSEHSEVLKPHIATRVPAARV